MIGQRINISGWTKEEVCVETKKVGRKNNES